MNVKTGDLVYFRTGSFLGKAIQEIADLEYNHVGIIVHVWGEPMVYEALGRGVISTPLKDRIEETEKIEIKRPPRIIEEKKFAIEAGNFLGKTPYDFKGLLWHQLVLGLTGKWIAKQSPDEARKKFYCYEYAAHDRDWETFFLQLF